MQSISLKSLPSAEGVVTPEEIARVVGQGGYWSRGDIARGLGREKTTYIINRIEMAVRMGLIYRCAGHVGNQRGYVYTAQKPMF